MCRWHAQLLGSVIVLAASCAWGLADQQESAESSLPAAAVAPASGPAASAPASAPSARPTSVVKVGNTVVFDPSLKPKGLAGVGLTEKQVNDTIVRARTYLYGTMSRDRDYFEDRYHVFYCLALAHAGLERDDPVFAKQLARTLSQAQAWPMKDTYVAGVLAMLAIDSGDDRNRILLERSATYLVNAQGPRGAWNYNCNDYDAVDKLLPKPQVASTGAAAGEFSVSGGVPLGQTAGVYARKTPWEVGSDRDNSCLQFAVMGLWSAARAGLSIDREVWKRCRDVLRGRQLPDGGCPYIDDKSPYGSMTCAFICASAICDSYLGQNPYEDQAIYNAIAWLMNNWAVKEPKPQDSFTTDGYYLYSLERAGRCLDSEFVGDKEWYPLGAKYLVDNQNKDGSWGTREQALETAYCLLFLTKATAALAPRPAGGDGKLVVEGPPVVARRVYFILDASASMITELDKKTKFQVAADCLAAVIKEMAPQTQVALRIYGNRFKDAPGGMDEDSTLEIPMGQLKRDEFLKKLESVIPRGRTPLAFSLDQAAQDLKPLKMSAGDPVAVVLLTDGWESTGKNRDPVAAARSFAESLNGVLFNVLGFDVKAADEVKQLQQIAQAGNGQIWLPADPKELATQLRTTVFASPGAFEVFDASGNKVADGRFGAEMTLKEGKYVLKTVIDSKPVQQGFWINTGVTTRLTRVQKAAPGGPGKP